MDKLEFAKMMVRRAHFDPLGVLWFALCRCSDWLSWEFRGGATIEEKNKYFECIEYLFGWGMFRNNGFAGIAKEVLTGKPVLAAPSHCNVPLHDYGLWQLQRKCTKNRYVEYHVRSNLYIEREASRAFLCIRQRVCRDVAGIIARMVARMYLDDYAWMQKMRRPLPGRGFVTMDEMEEMVRARISKTLPIDLLAVGVSSAPL